MKLTLIPGSKRFEIPLPDRVDRSLTFAPCGKSRRLWPRALPRLRFVPVLAALFYSMRHSSCGTLFFFSIV